MPRQRRLSFDAKPEPAPLPTSLIVTREQIPADLTATQKLVLRENLDINGDGEVFFFRDCLEVRRALRIGDASHD